VSWLLDADVLSQPVKAHGNRAVIEWIEREQEESYTSTIVIAQIAYWVRTKQGRARARLEQWLRLSVEALEGRILSFNTATAHVWADQKHQLEQAGQLMPIEDSYIAATARRHNLIIATGNEQDFRRPGLKVFNPFRELAPP
jgi:toxin FitB